MRESGLLIINLIEILCLIVILICFFETNINIFYIPHMILNVRLVITFLITNFGENYNNKLLFK